MAMKIYFAGPLFTPYERAYISDCAVRLRAAGLEVFVPHEAGNNDEPDDRPLAKKIYDGDFGGVSGANAILALLSGTEVDDGTACEIGIFHGLRLTDPGKKGIIGLLDDWRIKGPDGEGKGMNLIVRGCIEEGGAIYATLEDCLQHLLCWQDELTREGRL